MKTQFDILKTWMQARCNSDRGASLVEYALLVALIAVVAIAAIGFLGGDVEEKFTSVETGLDGTEGG